MNHRKAIPAKGTRFKAREIVPPCPASHAPLSVASPGIESRISTCAVPASTAKGIPAMAAARGVLSCLGRLTGASATVSTSDSVDELGAVPYVTTRSHFQYKRLENLSPSPTLHHQRHRQINHLS